MQVEHDVKDDVLLAVGGRHDCRLFKNPVGFVKVRDRGITYGLCPGSADLIGWQSVEITPDMVGQRVAVFLAIETKHPKTGTRRKQQRNFIEQVQLAGGKAGFARSTAEATTILGKS